VVSSGDSFFAQVHVEGAAMDIVKAKAHRGRI
jgi:hypothetical protein